MFLGSASLAGTGLAKVMVPVIIDTVFLQIFVEEQFRTFPPQILKTNQIWATDSKTFETDSKIWDSSP